MHMSEVMQLNGALNVKLKPDDTANKNICLRTVQHDLLLHKQLTETLITQPVKREQFLLLFSQNKETAV